MLRARFLKFQEKMLLLAIYACTNLSRCCIDSECLYFKPLFLCTGACWRIAWWRMELRGSLIHVCKYLKGAWEEERARLFLLMPSDRTRDHGHKLKHWKFPLNIRKHFSTVRVTKHWHRVPRKAVESLSLEVFKSHVDTVLNNLIYLGVPAWAGGLEKMGSRGGPC